MRSFVGIKSQVLEIFEEKKPVHNIYGCLFGGSSRGQQITEILKVSQTKSKADIKHPPSSSTWKILQNRIQTQV